VEDEPLARDRVVQQLARRRDFAVTGQASNGAEAVRIIDDLRPDLVLLDIELPELDGFEVLQSLTSDPPHVIFLTAYDQYAVRAFEIHAFDYLLKPVEPERLDAALDRARTAIEAGERPPKRIVIRSGDRILFLRPEEIDWLESVGNYVKIHRGAEGFHYRQTLGWMEQKLPNDRFVRIHRSRIVNVDRVVELRHVTKDAYAVVLSTGARLPLSPLYRRNLEERLGAF
jgi:two-component system LytT family response regulator